MNRLKAFRWHLKATGVFLVLVGIVCLTLNQKAHSSPSATASSNVHIATPLSITGLLTLEFGQVRPGDQAGTVVVTTANTRAAFGGAKVAASSAIWRRGEFSVTGTADAFYDITLQATIFLHDQGGTNAQLKVTDLKSKSVTKGVEGSEGKINPSGTDLIYIGGTLQVPSKATAKNGKYEGEVLITINY